jgi:hypothetical protein
MASADTQPPISFGESRIFGADDWDGQAAVVAGRAIIDYRHGTRKVPNAMPQHYVVARTSIAQYRQHFDTLDGYNAFRAQLDLVMR